MPPEKNTHFLSVENPKSILIVICLLALFLMADTAISYVADFEDSFDKSAAGIALFIIISSIYALGQFFIIRYLDSSSKGIRIRTPLIKFLHYFLVVVQYSLLVSLILVIIQIIAFSNYTIGSLVYSTIVSNGVAGILLGIFSLRFILWFKTNKRSIPVLLFALSFAILSLSEFLGGVSDTFLLLHKTQIVTPQSEVRFYDFPEGSFFAKFYDYYDYIDIASFLLMLCATSLLLYHYSRNMNMGRAKLAIVIGLPLLSYISGYLDALNIYDTDSHPDLFSYYIFQALSTISAGVLFAFSFWIIVRRMTDGPIRKFLITTAYGFVLFYISNSASVTVAPFPPVGLPTLSFLPLATYLILFGLYSSAISFTQNIALRKSVRSITNQDSNFLLSIGTAQMDIESKRLLGKIRTIVEEQEGIMAEQTGIRPGLNEEEIEIYLHEVISELKKIRKRG